MKWLVLAALFFPLSANAFCFNEAGAKYGVSPILLKAIQSQENGQGKADLVRKNNNGTYDYGLMQINSIWLSKLSRYGITERHLLDPCINVALGAWILSNHIAKNGLSWASVGLYHSATPWRRDDYAEKIKRRVSKIVNG